MRSKLGWRETADLLDWAYMGFPENERYQELLPYVRYFENHENKDGLTLKEDIEEFADAVKQREGEIKAELGESKILPTLVKVEPLFDRVGKHKQPVTCYLLHAPGSGIQGGANGDAISVEVPIGGKASAVRIAKIIIHEYTHKVLEIRHLLKDQLGEEASKFYRQGISSLHGDDLGGFFNEALTYVIADIKLNGENPQEEIQILRDREEKGDARSGKYRNIWEAALVCKPVLDDYFSGKTDVAETRRRIFQTSKDFIDRHLSQEKS